MDKKIVLLIGLLFFVGLVSAVAPQTVQTNVNIEVGLQIQTQGINILQQDTNHSLEFHVYNISDGLHVDNTTTDCTFHLYNKTGNVQYASNNLDFVGGSFEIILEGNNFTELGIYSYYIHCNATNIGGFAREVFEVTYTGNELSSASSTFYIVLFGLFIFLFLITIFGIDKLPSSNATDEEGTIIKISYLKYFRSILWFVAWMFIVAILYISSNLGFAYLEDTLFANFLFTLFKISFGLTFPIVVVWFVWIFAQIFDDKKIKDLWSRGMFGSKI